MRKSRKLVDFANGFVPTIGEELAADKANLRVKAEVARWKDLYGTARKELVAAEKLLEAWTQASEHSDPIEIRPRHKSSVDEAVAVSVLSDVHFEERIDKRTVGGLNEYTPEIAEARLKKFFENTVALVRKERSLARIDTLCLPILGDIITGHIHEELAETNWMHPLEALIKSKSILAGGIEFLLEHGGFKRIAIPCCYGNHGRSTKKMRIKNGAKTSYEWMMYHDLAQQFSKEKRVEFSISDGYLLYAGILGSTIRFHHGDAVKYQGGIGGVTVPLYKAHAEWDKTTKADYSVCGHWHSLGFYPRCMVNGSVIGYGEYSQFIKAASEPPQQGMFMIAKNHGPVCFNRVFCQ